MLSARSLCLGIIILFLPTMAVVAAVPKDILLVIDNSGSMLKHDPQFLVRNALDSFINKLNEDSRAGVLIFDQGVRLAVPLTAVDVETKAVLVKALDGVNYRGQWTDSPAAIERAIYELKSNGRDGADKIIVFMTDGDDLFAADEGDTTVRSIPTMAARRRSPSPMAMVRIYLTSRE